ncbi:CapA family protein [Patescibacteria group bacterium]
MAKKIIILGLFLINFVSLSFIVWGNWKIGQLEKARVDVKREKKNYLGVKNQRQLTENIRLEFPQINLEQIFDREASQASNLIYEETITLLAVGDVMLGRSVNTKSVSMDNFNWPFEKTIGVLSQADLTFVNLESPLLEGCPITNEGLKLCGGSRQVEGLINSGVDLVNLANNHIGDFGSQGIESSRNLLNQFGLGVVGLSGPIYRQVKGSTFAFLGYNLIYPNLPEVSWAERERVITQIKKAKELADLIVVSFHWGEEYTEIPNEEQIELAHLVINSGADLVIGHHPHWVQPIEVYQGKLIIYSLGNFIFDQVWSEKTKEGLVARFIFWENQLVSFEPFPVKMKSLGQPEFLLGEEKERALRNLSEASYQLIKP